MKHKLSKKIRAFIERVEGYDPDEYYIKPIPGTRDGWPEFWSFVMFLVIGTAVLLVPMREWIVWLMQ